MGKAVVLVTFNPTKPPYVHLYSFLGTMFPHACLLIFVCIFFYLRVTPEIWTSGLLMLGITSRFIHIPNTGSFHIASADRKN